MANWRKKIKLKDLLEEDESDEAVREVARQFVERLKRQSEYPDDFGFELIVQEFDDMSHCSSTGTDVYGGRFTLCDWFNKVLNDLYDWADYERVWID